MGTTPLPLRLFHRHQEDLIWRAAEADGAMGRKSIQGAIEARLEGGQGSYLGTDLLEDPLAALKEVTDRASFRAAGRARRIDLAICSCSVDNQKALVAAYWIPAQKGLEAWEGVANLVPLSAIAQNAFKKAKGKMAFFEWAARLSGRRTGVVGRDGRRGPPKATKTEVSLVTDIKRECERILKSALIEYVDFVRGER